MPQTTRPRKRKRWPFRFGALVSRRTVPGFSRALERDLGYSISPKTIYEWMSGRRPPSLANARAIMRVSGNRLKLGDVMKPSDVYRRKLKPTGTD